MRRPRFQFRLSTLLWITLAVACWFGGRGFGRHEMEQEQLKRYNVPPYDAEQQIQDYLKSLGPFVEPN